MLRNSKNAPYGKDSNFKGKKDRSGRKTLAEEFAEATTLKKLEIELSRVQVAMADKKLTEEDYKVLVAAADTFIKNILLLGGKPTAFIKLDLFKYAEWLESQTNNSNEEDKENDQENTDLSGRDISEQNI